MSGLNFTKPTHYLAVQVQVERERKTGREKDICRGVIVMTDRESKPDMEGTNNRNRFHNKNVHEAMVS